MRWYFTVKYGEVNTFAPAEPIKKLASHAVDSTNFYHLPLPDPKVIERIKQVIWAQFSEYVDGKGYYYDRIDTFEFAPSEEK
jgi:hypothetical protein